MKKLILLCLIILHKLSANLTFGDVESLEKSSVYYGLTTTASKYIHGGSDCVQKLTRTAEAISNRETWGLKVTDASGAPKTGIYWGNLYWLGSRKQCLSAYSGIEPMLNPHLLPITRESNETLVPFPVDYYGAYFYHNSSFQMFVHWQNETKITLGLCLPSSCSTDEISNLLQEYFDSEQLIYQKIYNTSLKMDEVVRTTLRMQWNDALAIIFFSWTVLSILMCILGTAYDVVWYQPSLAKHQNENHSQSNHVQNGGTKNGAVCHSETSNGSLQKLNSEQTVFQRILIGFSCYSNFKAIFTTKVNKDTLVPIAGLRFLLTNFIIFSHSYLFLMDYFDNRTKIFMYSSTYVGQIFQNSSFGVDAFFFLGGFLMVYSLSKSKDLADGVEHTNMTLLKLFLKGVFRRFRRLTPVYMYILLMAYTNAAFKRNISAFWTNERNDLQCDKYWWTNLLYVNNVYPGTWDTMCMSWSWYLACDMQFFIATSFVYFLSRKYFKAAVILILSMLFGSFLTLGTMAYITGYRPYIDYFYQSATTFYYPPWMRIGPYIVGALYGCLYRKLNGKLDIKKIYIYLFWATSVLVMGYLEFGFADKNFGVVKAVLHASLSRTMFIVGFGWTIFACLTGHGGFLNTIFSAEGWRPFSHLTYTAYLTNPVVLFSLVTNTESSWQFDESLILLIGNGLTVVTYMLSLWIVLSVELPFDKLFSILMEKKSLKPHKSEDLIDNVRSKMD